MKKRPFYFDTIADNYDEWLNEFDHTTRLSWFATRLDRMKIEGELVLDVGCGPGHFSRLVKDHGGIPVPLDIGGKVLSKTSGEMPNCTQGDALCLPFREATFSFVISSECVEHTPDPLLAIGEMVRVLRPGGYIVFTTPNHFWRWSVTVAKALQVRKFEGVENWPKRGDVRKALTVAGSEILMDEGLYLFPFQIRFLWPFLEWFNHRGQTFRRFMINQCWVARKV